ncbi:Oligoribonuclease [Bifidobacterium actinocoloniiforme DSM 22766]|uniref:Oligoribonuclease n=1 Tax=Bifidobacterium actinocoloniiforme DSM 22766 TaxID=1437605 RepID=A0A086Z1E0_9BIFI|nr:oligoribonuclease [Bifidobacterium actinocoloniiforme]AKV55490.1 oligoribonuclease [Bifidobacterium actinocoloniiforme DSM 22766]KFI40340.1 Oligoribonuclease [Bifidobacterium actinocoloniiforme DSM 22766]
MSDTSDVTFTPEESRMIWIDCEMTGLDIFHDELCEVSVVPTDFNLNVLDKGIDLVIKPSDAAVSHMGDFVRRMHTSSGLIDEWNREGLSLEEAQRQVVDYVKRFLPKRGKAHLAGNSVGSDKKFLNRYMPDLMDLLHYRVIDVSTLKELARRWYPAVYENKPAKHGGHRALADIIESADELRYYRDMFFAPAPGPDAQAAKVGARRVEDTSLLRAYEAQGQPVEDTATPQKKDY